MLLLVEDSRNKTYYVMVGHSTDLSKEHRRSERETMMMVLGRLYNIILLLNTAE
jgi:hypothetical protein